jgi:hypothetical protein
MMKLEEERSLVFPSVGFSHSFIWQARIASQTGLFQRDAKTRYVQ